uniref:Reverse transcriptase n=2 Tax=Cacopsylla melanoneura TaxID=428564 RepID=A0A8D8T1X5_9HEMI
MANQDHLHVETNILPVAEHNDMLTQQHLLACHSSSHPCNRLINEPLPPRNLRKSVIHCKPKIADLVPCSTLTPEQVKIGIKAIHSRTVEDTMQRYQVNRVLQTAPPPIAPEEAELPRRARSSLAQLRSGWSKLLNHYMNRLDTSIADECPLCRGSPHDTAHLFNCPGRPTTLTVQDLWHQPKAVAAFLRLEGEEDEEMTT